jgi:rhamnose utilization protein RhaD (predicted bifunctional aldolase and dehydrogenase)
MSRMDKTLAQLIKISRTVGRDKSLVLGSSGNTSVKTADGYMYIKASGAALKDMTARTGWRKLKLESVRRISENKSLGKLSDDKRRIKISKALSAACDDNTEGNIKPSIESCFHACLDKFVIHLHPKAVLSYACAKNGRKELEKLFKTEKLPPLWVPYSDPGCMLAEKMLKLTGDYKNKYGKIPSIIFLQNHGLVVTAYAADTAMNLIGKVVSACSGKLQKPNKVKVKKPDSWEIANAVLTIKNVFYVTIGQSVEVSYFFDEQIAGFLAGKETPRICSFAAITPDELAEAHGPAVWISNCKEKEMTKRLIQRIKKDAPLPTAFLIHPLGLFIAADKPRANFLKDVITTYISIRFSANSLSAINPITKNQRAILIKFAAK